MKVPFQEFKGRRRWIVTLKRKYKNRKLNRNAMKLRRTKQNGKEESDDYGSGARHS